MLCKGEENPLIRASGFPLPLRSPTFPQRCQRGHPFGNPSSCWNGVWLLEPFEPPCSRCSSRLARSVRPARDGQAHSGECVCPTRASEAPSSERVKTLHPSGARPSHRARETSYSEREGHLIPGGQWGFARASRGALHERAEGLCTGE